MSLPDVNILLLGETGVGKSTFINSFANYLQHDTMKDALKSELVCLIPTRFTIPDEEYNEKYITIGDGNHANENANTQCTKSYIFPIKNDKRRIRLIDTPDIGDALGVDQVIVNFENILSDLSSFDHLHAICFLLKPNVCIPKAYLKFCTVHLLSKLEKSAVSNIIFVFTNTFGTLHRPGEALTVLRRILQEVADHPPHVVVPYSKANMFCIDNGAFRFLVALKNDLVFTEAESDNFAHCWHISVQTCRRLLDYVAGEDMTKSIRPYLLRNTLEVAVNEARRVISYITKPLVDISDRLQDKLMLLELHEKDIDQDSMDMENFKKNCLVPVINLERRGLSSPVTVCTNEKCTEIITISGITRYHYKQRCHNPCFCKYTPIEIIGALELRNCWAMEDQHCHVCGCHFSTHMHIYYETDLVHTQIVDPSILPKIKTFENHIASTKKLINDLKKRCREFENEKDTITETVAKFLHVIKTHSVSFDNDAYEEYLDYLIARETNLGADRDIKFVKRHEDLKKQYQKMMQLLNAGSSMPQDEATPSSMSTTEIRNLTVILYNLKYTGHTIKQLHNT